MGGGEGWLLISRLPFDLIPKWELTRGGWIETTVFVKCWKWYNRGSDICTCHCHNCLCILVFGLCIKSSPPQKKKKPAKFVCSKMAVQSDNRNACTHTPWCHLPLSSKCLPPSKSKWLLSPDWTPMPNEKVTLQQREECKERSAEPA